MDERRSVVFGRGSTVCDYDSDRAPRAGWGQKIGAFLSDGVLIRNEAASGRSSKALLKKAGWSES